MGHKNEILYAGVIGINGRNGKYRMEYCITKGMVYYRLIGMAYNMNDFSFLPSFTLISSYSAGRFSSAGPEVPAIAGKLMVKSKV